MPIFFPIDAAYLHIKIFYFDELSVWFGIVLSAFISDFC